MAGWLAGQGWMSGMREMVCTYRCWGTSSVCEGWSNGQVVAAVTAGWPAPSGEIRGESQELAYVQRVSVCLVGKRRGEDSKGS